MSLWLRLLRIFWRYDSTSRSRLDIGFTDTSRSLETNSRIRNVLRIRRMLDQTGSISALPAHLLPRSVDQVPHTLWYMDKCCFLYFMFYCPGYNVRPEARTDLAGVDFHSTV